MSVTSVVYELKKAITEAEHLKKALLKEHATATPELTEKIEDLNKRIEMLKENLKLFQGGH